MLIKNLSIVISQTKQEKIKILKRLIEINKELNKMTKYY